MSRQFLLSISKVLRKWFKSSHPLPRTLYLLVLLLAQAQGQLELSFLVHIQGSSRSALDWLWKCKPRRDLQSASILPEIKLGILTVLHKQI